MDRAEREESRWGGGGRGPVGRAKSRTSPGRGAHRQVRAPLRHVDQGEHELGVHGRAHAQHGEVGRGAAHRDEGGRRVWENASAAFA